MPVLISWSYSYPFDAQTIDSGQEADGVFFFARHLFEARGLFRTSACCEAAANYTFRGILLGYGRHARAGNFPGDWTGNDPPCARDSDLFGREHLNSGVRFSTSKPMLARAFTHALDFWAEILDMDWSIDNSRNCSIQIVDGHRSFFTTPAQAGRAQFPDQPQFQGWIAFNPKLVLSSTEQYAIAVHELGHLHGPPHNPNTASVMYFLHLDGPVSLDAAGLGNVAARHKLWTTHQYR